MTARTSEQKAPAERRQRVVYSPVDILRLITAVLALGIVLVIVQYGARSLEGLEDDIISLTERLPASVVQVAVRLVQLVAVFAPLVGLVALVIRRQFRRLVGTVTAGVAGGVLGRWIMVDLLDLHVDRFQISGSLSESTPFPSAAFLAGMAAIVAADSPWTTSRWRQASRGWLGILLALRLFSGTTGIRELIVAVAVGWVVGSLVGALVGAPDRRPANASIGSALTRLGVSISSVDHVRSAGGRHHYVAMTRSSQKLWVEVAARDGWQTMLPGRLYRALRFRDAADGRPFTGLRELSEHEALVALKASMDGVPTPTLEAIGEVDEGGYLLAYGAVEGRSLRSRTDLGPEVLPQIWELLVRLRSARIAHRGLNQKSILVDTDDRMLVVGFDAGELTGDERTLAHDVAEMLAWTSERFGAELAVDAAITALGPGVVARALPRIQPLALTKLTRSEVSSELLDQIGQLVRDRTGADEPRLLPIERIKPRSVVMMVMLVVGINAVAPQIAGFNNVWNELRDVSAAPVFVVFLMSALSYVGAATGLAGSVAEPLPFGPNLAAQVASSFATVITPAQVGGYALKGRFLQRRGIDPAIAVAAIGINTIGAFLVHLTFMAAFAFWAGGTDLNGVSLPSGATIGLVLGLLALVIGVVAALPIGRRFATTTLLPAVKRSGQGIADVARRPIRLAQLLGGSAILTLSNITALAASVVAFNGHLPISAVALVYLVGAIVQSVAPTPGGLGAAEAAYIGGLTAIGLSSERAVAAVLLFRLATFWLPVLPGWLAMTWLQRNDAL